MADSRGVSTARSAERGALIALVLVVSAGACAAGSLQPGSAGASPTAAPSASVSATASPTPLPSATAVAAPTVLMTATSVPTPTVAATVAPTAAPTLVPTPKPAAAPVVKAIPTAAVRGTTFVFQLSGFPPGVDMLLTVTGPDGKTSAPSAWTISPSGTATATYATRTTDPSGPYVAVFKNGGVVAQVVFQLY